MADIEIEIDGKKLTAKPNQTVIQVADEAGIYIPRFCYHKNLSIPANCRMCLVDVEKAPKAVPACATPVMPGMKVFTKSQRTILAQRAVMEFLLINHPLDCPICDQGGECELQDLSMGYGSSHSDYNECKRAIADQDLGPLISSDMTRCIYCTRCVRFGDEIAGLREMGGTFRGGDTEIGTYVQHAIKSEVSGNIIDLCPVGALTSKPYRFKARAWELDQAPGVSPHDCMGTNLNVHTRYGRVMRVVTRENKDINETWIADRDRFSYEGLYHVDRLEEPLIRREGKWEVATWQEALQAAASGIQDTIAEFGADKFGALASPNSTLEEFYLLQKIVRGLDSPHVDHRLREMDTRDEANMPAFPGLNMPIEALEQADAILLIGSNLQKEQPIAALRVRKATLKGASVSAINPVDYNFNFKVAAKHIVAPQAVLESLQQLVAALNDSASSAESAQIAAQLRGKQNAIILVGALAAHHPQAASIRALAEQIAALTGATLGLLTDGANGAGAWLAGAVPHRHAGGDAFNHPGLNAYHMLEKARKAYLLLNVEPDVDTANAAHAELAMSQAKFVVAISLYRNPVLEARAHVILPMGAFTETAGTFVNTAGEWQSFQGVSQPFQSSRPAWKILRVLGNFLHLDGFDYESAEAIKHEVKHLIQHAPLREATKQAFASDTQKAAAHGLHRIGEVPLYAVDSVVRRSKPLQTAQTIIEGDVNFVRLHPDTARTLHVEEGDLVSVKQQAKEVKLPIRFDSRIARDAVWIAGGIAATHSLGDLFGPVDIQKV